MIMSQYALFLGYLAVVMLLDFVLPPVYFLKDIKGFLRNNCLRMIICILIGIVMTQVINKYQILRLSNTSGMILGSLFGLFLAFRFFKSDEFKNLKKNNA